MHLHTCTFAYKNRARGAQNECVNRLAGTKWTFLRFTPTSTISEQTKNSCKTDEQDKGQGPKSRELTNNKTGTQEYIVTATHITPINLRITASACRSYLANCTHYAHYTCNSCLSNIAAALHLVLG